MNRNNKIRILLLSFLNMLTMSSCKPVSSDIPNETKENRIEIYLSEIVKHEVLKDKFALIFVEKQDQKRKIVMTIGAFEAQVVVVTIENIKSTHPLSIDVLEDFIIKSGYKIKEVMIDSLKDSVYTAKILCSNSQNEFWLEAMSSDAATLAYKFNCPIYIDKKVFDDNSF